MADHRLRTTSSLVFGLVAIGSLFLAIMSTQALWVIVLWAGAIAAGQAVRVPTISGQPMYLGVVAAFAMPLLVHEHGAVAAAYGLGLLGSWIPMTLRGESMDDRRIFFLSEVVALAAYGIVALVTIDALARAGMSEEATHLIGAIAGAIAWFSIGSLVRALLVYEERRFALRYLWLSSLADWPVVLTLFATGVLFALAYPDMGLWAFAVAATPYAFSHVSFVRYADTRVTYGQTIRALARIPEVAGLAPTGHSARTAELAVSIAQELGMRPDEVTELEYAALMHDIGRITLNEPAIIKAGYTDEDIARWGSQIIGEAPYLRRVSEYVAKQHEPYRRPGVEIDEGLPAASKIIKVSSAYDQAVQETGLPPIEAIEVLHRGAAYDFDPGVVSSLRRVVSRRGAIAD